MQYHICDAKCVRQIFYEVYLIVFKVIIFHSVFSLGYKTSDRESFVLAVGTRQGIPLKSFHGNPGYGCAHVCQCPGHHMTSTLCIGDNQA